MGITAGGRRLGWTRRVSAVLVVVFLAALSEMRLSALPPMTWTVRIGTTPVALAVDQQGGRVVVADSAAQSLLVLDAHSGAALATIALGHIPLALALDERQGRIFTRNACEPALRGVGTCGGVSVLALSGGTLLGTVLLQSPSSLLAVDERARRVFAVQADDGTLRALDAGSGRPVFSVASGMGVQTLAVDGRSQRVFLGGSAARGPRHPLTTLDGRTGARLRTVDVGPLLGDLLCDTRAGRVLVPSTRGLALLDARTGALLGRVGPPALPLAVDEPLGHALIARQGHLRVISTRDGTLVGTGSAPDVRTWLLDDVAVDEAAGRFYVAAHAVVQGHGQPTTRARLFVLDGQSGRMRRVVPLAVPAVAMAVDTATQRLFIVNSGASLRPAGEQPVLSWLRHMLRWLPRPPRSSTQGTLTVVDTTRL